MGLFGFGKKRKAREEAEDLKEEATQVAQNEADHANATDADDAQVSVEETAAESGKGFTNEIVESYDLRGEEYGPWDVNDDDVPDYDEYLSLGSYYLPFLQRMELRVKASRATNEVLGTTVTLGASSVEVEAFAAPKTLGLWDDVRADLLEANPTATEVDGVFGKEVQLPVKLKGGKTLITRIVGVDGPRWMLRGIFSGLAATDPEAEETKKLNEFFSNIVVERGDEPLAPRDLIPMHAPLTPKERKAQNGSADEGDAANVEMPKKPTGPFDSDQQVEQKTTLSRGPMFSELR